MTPDELRALADALIECGEDAWPTPPEPIQRAADYLRAQADAQPVGYATANGLRMLKQDDATVLLYKHDYLIRPDHVALYTHPAPAVPQAEPKRPAFLDEIDRAKEHVASWPQWMKDATHTAAATLPQAEPIDPHMIVAEDRFPDAQAEPKREPLSDERIDEIGEPFGYFQYGDAQGDKRRAFIDRLTRARDEARAERDAMANVLPGHYYMDPPDGGDVPVLEQLRRMAKDAARYRFLSCKGVPPYFHRCSRWRLEYWNGEWWDPLMKEELDAAIDAQIEKERSDG